MVFSFLVPRQNQNLSRSSCLNSLYSYPHRNQRAPSFYLVLLLTYLVRIEICHVLLHFMGYTQTLVKTNKLRRFISYFSYRKQSHKASDLAGDYMGHSTHHQGWLKLQMSPLVGKLFESDGFLGMYLKLMPRKAIDNYVYLFFEEIPPLF